MRLKVLNLSVVLASLVGYLEWGGGHSVFLFQAEADLFAKALGDPAAVMHPFTVLPVLGQLLLVFTLFQKTPGKAVTYAGIGGVGLLLVLMFVIGVIDTNVRVLLSTVPFLVMAALTIRAHRSGLARDHQ
jgi:hypothetical protein